MKPLINFNLPEPQQPTAPPGPKGRGPFYWAGQVVLFPFRLMGMLILVLTIPGAIRMWELPTIADQNRLDLTLLTLAAVSEERSVSPFLPLGYRPVTQANMVDLTPEKNYFDDFLMAFTANSFRPFAVGVSTKSVSGGYEHTVEYNHKPTRTVPSTSRHLTASAADMTRSRQAVEALFPTAAQQELMLQWGESLFWTEWIRIQELNVIRKPSIPEPLGGTTTERYWLVWQVLRGPDPAAEQELTRLPQLFQQAFPKEEDQQAALKWAQGLFERMEERFATYQKFIKKYPGTDSLDSPEKARRQVFASFKRVLPPKGRWTYQWMLYRCVGLSEASRAAARRHWLSRFPPDNEADVLQFGEALVAERRAAGEPLPPVPETLPLLCVAERLTGWDPYGQVCRGLIQSHFSDEMSLSRLHQAIFQTYPNDEIFFLLASGDALQMHPMTISVRTWQSRLEALAGNVFVILVVALGITTLLNWVIAPRLMTQFTRPLWQKHREGRGHESGWLWLASLVVFAAVGAVVAPYSLPQVVGIQVSSFGERFLGALAAIAVGGTLIGTFRRILAVFLVALGVDVESSWGDEFFGILIGAWILYHFGNGPLAIALFALSDFAPGFLYLQWQRRRILRGLSPHPA